MKRNLIIIILLVACVAFFYPKTQEVPYAGPPAVGPIERTECFGVSSYSEPKSFGYTETCYGIFYSKKYN